VRSRDHVTGTSNGCSVVVCISAVRRENFVSIERELSTTEWHVSFVYGAEIIFTARQHSKAMQSAVLAMIDSV